MPEYKRKVWLANDDFEIVRICESPEYSKYRLAAVIPWKGCVLLIFEMAIGTF